MPKQNRVHQVNVRLNDIELEKLTALSDAAGVTLSESIRRLIVQSKVK